jgi:ATP-dependent DNA helicase RecG
MADSGNFVGLIRELQRLAKESPWVEFKVDNARPDEIGEYISALANSAAIEGKSFGYVLWGISDDAHELVGTHFDPTVTKIGNEELESWLLRLLSPKINFRFCVVDLEGHRVVVLEIERAISTPVQFKGAEFIRVGSYKKLLKDNPQLERQLWRVFDHIPFESLIAHEGLNNEAVLEVLDWETYYSVVGRPASNDVANVVDSLAGERMIAPSEGGEWNITNLGAISLARNLSQFPRLGRKAIRIVRYSGKDRTSAVGEHIIESGYVAAFTAALAYLELVLPKTEIVTGRRSLQFEFPPIAVRELLANALIHQDFSIVGAGPLVEIFSERIEVSNPGAPLVDTQRFLDSPPRSRNESLASFMRRIGVCEERGSGIDKVVLATEEDLLPAPDFRTAGDNTIAVLLGRRELGTMARPERIRAVYLHACLRYVSQEELTNTSIRERFGLDNATRASRLISDAVASNVIRLRDPDAGRKHARYVPFWA